MQRRDQSRLVTCGRGSSACTREQTEPRLNPNWRPSPWMAPDPVLFPEAYVRMSESASVRSQVDLPQKASISNSLIRVAAYEKWLLESGKKGEPSRGFCRDCEHAVLASPADSTRWWKIAHETPEHIDLYCSFPEHLDLVHGTPRRCDKVIERFDYCWSFKVRKRP